MASQLSQSSSWCQLRTISKIRINLSFMLWRNRTLKRLSSIFHQTKRPGLIEYPLECLKTVYQSPYPLLPIWLILRSHPIALHRCGSPQWSSQTSNPENTRPISLLPMMSKVCERAANTQFMDFLDNSKISGLQSGNRKFYSTETTRLHYTGQLLQNTDENEYLLLYYLTCLKLSTASNGKTYYRGCTYWVSDPTLAWFKSYLSLRKQVVRIGSVLSDPSHWQ